MSTSDHAIIAHSGGQTKPPCGEHNEETVFSSTSSSTDPRKRCKTTGDRVVEIWFNSAVYMVSPHPERGNAMALTMQGHSMVIPVATVLVEGAHVGDVIWETPFNGRPPEWQGALLDLVKQHGYPVIAHVGVRSGEI